MLYIFDHISWEVEAWLGFDFHVAEYGEMHKDASAFSLHDVCWLFI